MFYSLDKKPNGKDLLLNVSDHTLVASLDGENIAALQDARKQFLDEISKGLADSMPQVVEMLAIPLHLVPNLTDPVDIKANLEPAVGIQNWPLNFHFTNFGIEWDADKSNFYFTAQVVPDRATRVTLECQFFKHHRIEPYPTIRLYKLSDAGKARIRLVETSSAKLPTHWKTKRTFLKVQLSSLVLVTPWRCFRLRLCGLEADQNSLQWHDIAKTPGGYQDRDLLGRFKDWGPDNRLRMESNLDLTLAQANTPLGRLCPWMTQSSFKEGWQGLSPLNIIWVAVKGTVSRADRIVSLIDTAETTRLLRESIRANFGAAGQDSAMEFLKTILGVPTLNTPIYLDEAVSAICAFLEGQKPKDYDINKVRWSNMGFNRDGSQAKRPNFPEARQMQVPPLSTHSSSYYSCAESAQDKVYPYPTLKTGLSPRDIAEARATQAQDWLKRTDSRQQLLTAILDNKGNANSPYNVATVKSQRLAKSRKDWLASLRLPAPGFERRWRNLIKLLKLPEPLTPAKIKGLLKSQSFHSMVRNLEALDQAELAVNLWNLLDSLEQEPDLAMALYTAADVQEQYSAEEFSPDQREVILNYANVLNMAVASKLVQKSFDAVPLEHSEKSGVLSGSVLTEDILDEMKRHSLGGIVELSERDDEIILGSDFNKVLGAWSDTATTVPDNTEQDAPDLTPSTEPEPNLFDMTPEWIEQIGRTRPEVVQGKEYHLPEEGANYEDFLGGLKDTVYELGQDGLSLKEYPPLYSYVTADQLWAFTLATAQELARLRGMTGRVLGVDISNAWLLIKDYVDSPTVLMEQIAAASRKIEDALMSRSSVASAAGGTLPSVSPTPTVSGSAGAN